MFSFDKALLPQLTTRKALILVDFQNDFLDPNGALPSTEPDGLVDRAVQLVSSFRGKGDIIWLQSQFEKPVLVDPESIIICDAPPAVRQSGRGRPAAPVIPPNSDEPLDSEAFLSHPEPTCVKPSSWGAKMSPVVERAVKKGDTVLSKSQYSGFSGTQLLRLLRAKMVMEVYICGSLANVGVHATALDAAGHGLTITVVDDCCGYRSEQRQLRAVRNLMDLTGCEIAAADELVENLEPLASSESPRPITPTQKTPAPSSAVTAHQHERMRAAADIVRHMEDLRLDVEPPATGAGNGAATSPTNKADSQKAQPKQQETIGKEEESKENVSEDVGSLESIAENDKNHTLPTLPASQESTSKTTTTASTNTKPHNRKMSPHHQDSVNSDEGQILQKGLCEGDTDIIENVLPEHLVKDAFDKLRDEVQWQRMLHQGGEVPRLVAVQGEVSDDGSMPVYRHPSDESPPLLSFSPTVMAIKAETEKHLGHPLNHVLIQFYRDGMDYISEHSDKTIDVVKGSYIANVSLGAERTMVFRTKRQYKDPSRTDAPSSPPGETKRQAQRAQLPHNSLCRMGLKTNMKWLHSIRQDKRREKEKTPAELAFAGGRISLTFRQIGTFLDKNETIIWGQGATSKTRETAKPVINGQTPTAIEMLKAFGAENNSSLFDWETRYGNGFDVLHISNSPRFFASADKTANMRISLMLAEHDINHAKGCMAPDKSTDPSTDPSTDLPIRFVDNDTSKSTIEGDVAIMLYLDSVYAHTKPNQSDLALIYTRFQRALNLGALWRQHDKSTPLTQQLRSELSMWNGFVKDGHVVGSTASLADFAIWPVLHGVAEQYEGGLDGWVGLKSYYEAFGEREATKKVLGKEE